MTREEKLDFMQENLMRSIDAATLKEKTPPNGLGCDWHHAEGVCG